MSASRLDPETQHTVLELIDGGVRLDRTEISAVDALVWASENGVNLDGPGGVEAQINAARAARNLRLFKVLPPPKSILGTTASLTAKIPKPAPTPVAAPQAQAGEVSMDVVFKYARSERITWNRTQPLLEQVNDYRKGWGLMPFRIMAKDAKPADYVPEPAFIDLERPSEPKSQTWSGLMPTTEAQLLDLVYNFNGMISGVVTPECARWILTLNTGNRKLNRSGDGVKRFIKLLRTGHWMLTGEPIIISSEGIINDGQHRLHAIAESGIGGHLDIRFGIDRSAFVATNTGVRRSVGQVLGIAGRPYGPMQGSVARFVYFYSRGETHKLSEVLESMQIVDIVDNEPLIGRVSTMVNKLSKFRPIRNSSFASIMTAAAQLAPFEKVEEFARLTESGQGEEYAPTRRLHSKLADIRMSKLYIPKLDTMILVALAWNAWIRGKTLRAFVITDDHRTGYGFPRVLGPHD